MTDYTLKAETGIFTVAGQDVDLLVRRNMALGHFKGAALFSRELLEIEHSTTVDFEDVRARSVAVAMMLFAGLDAYLGELSEIIDDNATKNKLTGQGGIIQKFDDFKKYRGSPPVDTEEGVGAELKLLARVRNAVVHYRPAIEGRDQKYDQLDQDLQGRFAANGHGGGRYFPRGWEGHAFSVWAIGTVRRFVEEICESEGLPTDIVKPLRF